jgi:hypothetical protein
MQRSGPRSSNGLRTFLQIVFLVWLFAINVLYYIQFKQVLLVRIASLVHR